MLVMLKLVANRTGQLVRVSARYGNALGANERGMWRGCGGCVFGFAVWLSKPGRTRFAKGSVKSIGSHSHVVNRMRERKPGRWPRVFMDFPEVVAVKPYGSEMTLRASAGQSRTNRPIDVEVL
jgi:hypothetical protein